MQNKVVCKYCIIYLLFLCLCLREIDTKAKKLLEKTEIFGQLSQEVRKCIQSASTLDDIETLSALHRTKFGKQSSVTAIKALK